MLVIPALWEPEVGRSQGQEVEAAMSRDHAIASETLSQNKKLKLKLKKKTLQRTCTIMFMAVLFIIAKN